MIGDINGKEGAIPSYPYRREEMIELTTTEKQRIEEALDKYREKYPSHRILFASVAGSHLYGTKTDDADIDLRGCYIVPTETFLGLNVPEETTEFKHNEVEFQFHEIGKFIKLLLLHNMNFIEWLEVPENLRVVWGEEASLLRNLGHLCMSKDLFEHIRGMSIHTWRHAEKEHFLRPKRNLYLYREILRGLVLFDHGKFISDVTKLAEYYGDIETSEWVKYNLKRKALGEQIEPVYVMKIKKNIQELQERMVRSKEFSALMHETKVDKGKIERWLVALRKAEMKE